MQEQKTTVSRRALIQSLAFLPGVAAVAAAQDPATAQKDREVWNGVFTRREPLVTGYPNRFLADIVQGRTAGRALDIGIGQGRNSLHLARVGWDVTGVDVSDEGIKLANDQAAKLNVKINCVVSDFAAFDVGKERWDLVVGVYMGDLILGRAARIVAGLPPGGLLVVENYHRDINRPALAGGAPIGYPVNALLETFAPSLRIVRYEEVSDFPDWSNQSVKVPLVRMLAKKG